MAMEDKLLALLGHRWQEMRRCADLGSDKEENVETAADPLAWRDV